MLFFLKFLQTKFLNYYGQVLVENFRVFFFSLRGKILNEKHYNFSSRLCLYLILRCILMKYYERDPYVPLDNLCLWQLFS